MSAGRLAVAIVSHQFASPQPTGVDRYGRELTVALAARDELVVSLCGPAEPRTVSPAAAARPDWLPSGVPVRRVPGPRRAVVLGWWVAGRPRIDRTCGPVDVVHATLPLFPVPTRRPLVVTVHDLFPRQHPDWYSRQARFGFARALRSLERAAAVIAVSTWTAEALRGVPWVDPARVTVVPEGVTPRFAAEPAPDEITLWCRAVDVEPGEFDLFVGQASARKNLRVVVEALARARTRRPLVIAGPPGDATASIRELADHLGVASRLRWLGFVSDSDLHLALHAARTLLHPCPEEGFGLTPLEAMCAGTPAVVADAGALPETVGDAALRCDPFDVDAWADAIDAFADEDLAADLSARGRLWAARYNWSDVAERTVGVYRAVLDGQPSSTR